MNGVGLTTVGCLLGHRKCATTAIYANFDDATLQGFVLSVQPNGARSWVFRFHRDRKPRRVIPGKHEMAEANQAWGAQFPWSRNSTFSAKSNEARTGAQPCQLHGPIVCVT